MNKFKRYKPDFDSEEGRKIFYYKVWDLIKYLFILSICLFVCFLVTFWAVVSNRNDNESAYAEVSSLVVNTEYEFTIPPTGFNTMPYFNSANPPTFDLGLAGTIIVDGVSSSFTAVSYFPSDRSTRVNSRFIFYDSGYQILYNFNNVSGVSYFSSNSSLSTNPSSIHLIFTSITGYNGSYTTQYNTIMSVFRSNLSVYVPPVVDHRPDLRGLYNYELNGIYTNFDFNTQTTTYSTYTNDLYVFEVYNLDSTQLTAVGTSFYTFEISYSAGHYNSSTDSYITNSGTFTGYAPYSPSPIGYITIAVDLSYWNLFSLYYPEYANDDNNQLDISYDDSETNLLWRQIKDNYDSIHGMSNDSRSTRSAYLQGYEAGSNADKTLLSVMWQTFNLPFRLLFGTYDDVQSSPTYGQYVGGLFNFTILGVDIRAFCIGIMSFAIVLAVVRFIIGIKG